MGSHWPNSKPSIHAGFKRVVTQPCVTGSVTGWPENTSYFGIQTCAGNGKQQVPLHGPGHGALDLQKSAPPKREAQLLAPLVKSVSAETVCISTDVDGAMGECGVQVDSRC